MVRTTSPLAGFVFLLLFRAADALAQGSTASIIGRVTDESGAVLPGVTVTASSPALQLRDVVALTDSTGEYRLTQLPIGTYRVRYELSGFQAVQLEDVRLTLGFVASISQVLKVGALEESLTVSGRSPVIDVTSATPRTQFIREVLEELPTTRNGFLSLTTQAPGIRTSATGFDVGGSHFTSTPSFNNFGRAGDNFELLEGVMTSSPSGSTQGVYVDFSTFEEANIQTVGNSAEMPLSGVWLNSIVKSGGNDFHGNLYYALTGPWAESSNIDDQLRAAGVTGQSGLIDRRDISGDVGGRILRDKLWFYVSARAPKDEREILNVLKPDGTPGTLPKYQAFWTTKLSYQMSPNHRLVGLHQWNKKRLPDNYSSQFVPWASRADQDQHGNTDKVEWSGAFGGSVVASAQVGYWEWICPLTGYSHGQVGTYDIVTQMYSGDHFSSHNTPAIPDEFRYHARGSLTWFKKDFLSGDHEIKTGFDYIPTTKDWMFLPRGASGDYSLRFQAGTPFQLVTYNKPVHPFNKASYTGAYVQDNWRMGRLTLSLGLRFDRNNAWIPEQTREAGTFTVTETFPRIQFPVWHALAPRLHFAYALTNDGKTVLKGGWGRFNQARYTNDVEPVNPNSLRQTIYTWRDLNGNRDYDAGEVNLDPNGTDFVDVTAAAGAQVATRVVNPNEEQPWVDELSLSLERELMANFALRVTGVYSREANLRRLVGVDRPYDSYNIPITKADPGPDNLGGTADDPGALITYYEYPATLQGAALAFTMPVNDPNYVNSYKGFEIAANKRSSNNWQLMSSFTFTWKDMPFAAREMVPLTPNEEIFAGARTREWFGKAGGSYRLPWGGLLTSANLNFVNGNRYQRTVLFTGGRTIPSIVLPVEPLDGSRSFGSAQLLDVRLEKTIRLGGTKRLMLRADLFNALNTNTVTNSSNRSGASFERPSAIMPARIAVFGFQYDF
ncbi:MAG: TonB-dependent receptor [Luteitalea sp.]|nr:TonB-dependent receptor [Luteitalea sp.]